MVNQGRHPSGARGVSVLFDEPKLLKCCVLSTPPVAHPFRFSALQRAEIAEMKYSQ